MIQIESDKIPFQIPKVVYQAVTALGRADAMGLVPQNDKVEKLDVPSFRRVFRYIQRAGIGKTIQFEMVEDPAEWERALRCLNLALEESPSPEFEWSRMLELLGLDLLSRLLGISASSIRRYSAASRTTPDDDAVRLHFLSLLVGDLSGAYNEIGVRQWFDRKRAQLGGKAPSEVLKGRWKPEDAGPSQVRELGSSLVASPAT